MKTLALLMLLVVSAWGQNPQTPLPTSSSAAPLISNNVKYLQGVGTGFWVQRSSGLTVSVAPGTSFCSLALQSYAGGSLSMADNSTNYVYLNAASSCAPASNTTGWTTNTVPLAVVVTSGGAVTSITEGRTFFSSALAGGGGGGGGPGITSLNALTAGTQVFATGTSGTDFGINSTGSTHTFNIPSASAVARGLVTTGSQTIAGAKTFSSPLTVGASGINSGCVTFAGGTSGTVQLCVPTAAGSSNTVNLPTLTGAAGAWLQTDGGNPQTLSWSTTGPAVNVNGSSVSSPNFNGTTPAAAMGNVNVTWQVSGSNVSAQVDAADVFSAATGVTGTGAVHQPTIWTGTSSIGGVSAGAADAIFMGANAGVTGDPAFKAGPSGGTNGCAGAADTPTYNTTTHAWGCHQIPGTVSSVATTSPITGGTITTTGTIACATCAIGPGSSTANHLAKFSGTDGITLADGGAIPAGTVTSVATGTGLTGGTITTTGTLSVTTAIDTFTKSFGLLDWTDNSDDGKLQFEMGQAVHLTRAYCSVVGATNAVINLDKRAEGTPNTDTGNHLLDSDLTCTTSGANTATFANGSGQCGGTLSCAIALHNNVVLTITSVSGAATGDALRVTVEGTID